MRTTGRFVRTLLATTVGTVLLACELVGQTLAQSDPGTITGQVVVCRDDFAPVGDASADTGALLQDIPSPGGGRPLVSVPVPVANLIVGIDGTSLWARTDERGRFSLVGVPTAQPLTITAFANPSGPAGLQIGSVVATAGQTVDVGMLVLGGAGESRCVPEPQFQ